MSDLATQRDLARRLEQTQVTERPGGVTGYDTFYSTGTWIPTYVGNTTAGVTTYSFQVGGWVRIGKLAVVTGLVVWTAATGTGNANFGLPFTSENVTNQFFSGSVRVDSVTFANSAPQIVMSPNLAFFNLVSPITNAASATVVMEAAGNVVFTISYFVQ